MRKQLKQKAMLCSGPMMLLSASGCIASGRLIDFFGTPPTDKPAIWLACVIVVAIVVVVL